MFRLSPTHQASGWVDLSNYMEILVGTVRFQSADAVTVTERIVEDAGES